MNKRNLFPDKYIGYHTFGLGVDNTSVESTNDLITNGHEYVDLGLPSGTLWAKYNVGAETETDYGLYFAWGETQGYTASQVGTDKNFTWADYKLNPTGDGTTFTKYNLPDRKTTLDIEDDAAHVNMGGRWVMPTSAQIKELLDASNTTHIVRTSRLEHVTGMEFKSVRNGNTLFIPFAGSCSNGTVVGINRSMDLWFSLLDEERIDKAFKLNYDSRDGLSTHNVDRCFGGSIRGVLNKL